MKKKLSRMKKPLIITLLAALIISYYVYLTHRNVDNTDKLAGTTNELLSRDMVRNYPSDYYDVVDYFLQIQKIIYKEDLTDDEITGYAQHMRALWDDELLAKPGNDYETYLNNLKAEIEQYKANEKYVNEYSLQRRRDVEPYTIDGKMYARITVKYYMREGGKLIIFYERYTLRKDTDDKWKILYWEVSDGTEMEE